MNHRFWDFKTLSENLKPTPIYSFSDKPNALTRNVTSQPLSLIGGRFPFGFPFTSSRTFLLKIYYERFSGRESLQISGVESESVLICFKK